MRVLPTMIAAISVVLAIGYRPALAQDAGAAAPSSWPAIKCARYTKSYSDLIARRGTRGLSPDFLASHEAFLKTDCSLKGDVCPRSPEELEVANAMVVLGMNQGMASTFMPFACRR